MINNIIKIPKIIKIFLIILIYKSNYIINNSSFYMFFKLYYKKYFLINLSPT